MSTIYREGIVAFLLQQRLLERSTVFHLCAFFVAFHSVVSCWIVSHIIKALCFLSVYNSAAPL